MQPKGCSFVQLLVLSLFNSAFNLTITLLIVKAVKFSRQCLLLPSVTPHSTSHFFSASWLLAELGCAAPTQFDDPTFFSIKRSHCPAIFPWSWVVDFDNGLPLTPFLFFFSHLSFLVRQLLLVALQSGVLGKNCSSCLVWWVEALQWLCA